MAEKKEKEYSAVVEHACFYLLGIAVAVIPWFDYKLLCYVFLLAITHFLIDSLKFGIVRKPNLKSSCMVFIADQFLHFLCIVVLSAGMYCYGITLKECSIFNTFLTVLNLKSFQLIRWLLLVLLIWKPANVFIKTVLDKYKSKKDEKIDNNPGELIGFLERLILIILMSLNQYGAIGFVLTAKSIARHSAIVNEKMTAEYYLMGTLLSIVFATVGVITLV